ncbi:hypothetical protein GKA01_13210 [Gluconobacter kanchanaburiensis NBRC 103587]|uniref:Uncharacterized protein n=1 Tax=Gluconobacter kanchanaburiensis NBRC 103587 TaxID=1307948 RepID=A0A511B6Z4_9PROT|nr:hypothetical protein AA103587_1346 [Gluconobacter kanchanaburiensis NBRC 103587]GEK96124.1 hypothetical protein GKA01_13210 [Gluconobacter kanchanaburiensis NBRC 103587]
MGKLTLYDLEGGSICGDGIVPDILTGKFRGCRIGFQSDSTNTGNAGTEAQQSGAGTASRFQNRLPRSGGNGGCHQHGFKPGAVSVAELVVPNPSTKQKSLFRPGGRDAREGVGEGGWGLQWVDRLPAAAHMVIPTCRPALHRPFDLPITGRKERHLATSYRARVDLGQCPDPLRELE